MLGNLGHLSIVIALVAILLAVYAYVQASKQKISNQQSEWTRLGHLLFGVHSLAVLAAIGSLYSIIYFHHYEYQYAWDHSSSELPFYFIISCFWEGQEGSFLLWIFWNVLIGWLLIRSKYHQKASILAVFALIQLFLVSMVVGTHIGDLKIGSSPFMLLRDTMNSEIFKVDPDFVPLDGNGLNPLLQNIWMVIHPPVIFLGFALSAVPFSIVTAGLWKNNLKHLINTTAPWTLACVGVLGVGIIMGAYWAYETLNFGGYWNWDPVENAVLIPWLVLLAAIHGMTLYRRKGKGLALTLTLLISGFILIVYSTFLTRSGVLGNASVHSFTDLGLSGQLLLFLLFFTVISFGLIIYRRDKLREPTQNVDWLSLEFWMLLGVCVLCLSAFQVLLPTSIPVFNIILENFGIDKNMAPPADPVGFYSKFQIWFAMGFCLLAGLGQAFYWKRITNRNQLESILIIPVAIALIAASVVIYIGQTFEIGYICLIAASLYLIAVSIQIGWSLIRNMERVSLGGTLAHLGMALMLIGFVYSAGHQKIISQNLTINAPDSNLPAHTIQENLLLNRGIAKENNGYSLTYANRYFETTETGEFIPTSSLIGTELPSKQVLATAQKISNGWLDTGDTININTENTYYALMIEDPNGTFFQVTPRMQNNPTMGYIASPDIKSFFTRDIYTHITNFPDPDKIKWNEPETHTVKPGQPFTVKGLTCVLESISINKNAPGIPKTPGSVPLEAEITIYDHGKAYTARPIFHIDHQRSVKLFPDEIEALGTKILLSSINPETQEYELTTITSQRDWITIKSIEMPMIGLVWLGAIIMFAGVGVAFYFRLAEAREVYTQEYVKLPLKSASNWEVIINNNKAIVNKKSA